MEEVSIVDDDGIIDLYICFPAFLQFYYLDNESITYTKLSNRILEYINKDEDIKVYLQKLFDDIEENKKFRHNLELEQDIKEKLKYLLYDFLNEITYVSDTHLVFLLQTYNKNQRIIFYNDNPFHLLIDKIIISNFPHINLINDKNISYYTTSDLIHVISSKNNPKNYLIMNQKISTLHSFHNIGCWTILLTPTVYSHYDIKAYSKEDPNREIYNTIYENCEYLKLNDKFYSFSSTNFYQLAFYYNEMIQVNKLSTNTITADSSTLKLKIENELKPIRVLIFIRTLMRRQVFKKQRLFLSNNQVIYYSHVGGEDVSLNKEKYDVILVKAVELSDCIMYKKLFENIISYSIENKVNMINDLRNLKWFVEKDLMSEFLKKFVECEYTQAIQKKYNISLRFPQSFTLELQDIIDRKKFLNYLRENGINFPLIIKYKGLSNFFKHMISFIFDEKFLDNFINFIKDIHIPEKDSSINVLNTKCVIQSFLNHGGHVLKFYRLNFQNFLDYRSSLPDLNKDFQSKYVEGYWNFKTIELETEEYKKMWKIYFKENLLKKILRDDDNKKLKFLNEIVEEFEKFSKFTLYGLDLLYDIESHFKGENNFYLIDCNALPSYKIQSIDVAEYFRNHFVNNSKNK